MVKLSIVIATYNRARYIVETLDSLLLQTLDSNLWEVVVVNNNSSDNTSQVVEQFAEQHPEISVRCVMEHRQGLSYARNCGIELSKGEYIVIIDDDELANSVFAETYYNFFETHPDVSVCGGVMEPNYEIEPPQWISPITAGFIASAINLGTKMKPFPRHRYPIGGNMGFRRVNFERYGNFNVDLGRTGSSLLSGEEKDLINRFRMAGEKVYYLPDAVILHSIPASRLTNDYFDRVTAMIGLSEQRRTLNISRCAYAKSIFMEGVKWCAAMVLAVGYCLKLQPIKGLYLLRMRFNITRGLLSVQK